MVSGNAIKVKELTERVSDVIAENRKNWGSSYTYRESQQWWRKVDSISLRKRKTQFVLDGNFLEGLTDFFGNLCHDSEYVEPDYVDINPGTVISPVLDEYQAMLALSKSKNSASGPDGIPHWVWKENAEILAPVITVIWNLSLRKHTWPSAWKQANINPLPKVHTPLEYQDFRDINVTPITARCYFQKAFDTVSHEILSLKLNAVGISGPLHQWLIDFFL